LLASSPGFILRLAAPFQLLLILPALGPALAALITRRLERSDNAEFRGLDLEPRMHAHWRWYVLAVATLAIILLIAHVFSASLPLTAGSLAPRHGSALISVLALSVLANPFEEIGWRGFALPRLQAAHGR
jgi:membrane protease YdiL (CAAX protease family)